MSFVARLATHAYHHIYLVQANDNGKAAWYYIKVEPNKIKSFLNAIGPNPIDLESYGAVLAYGWGKTPPADVTIQIAEDFAD